LLLNGIICRCWYCNQKKLTSAPAPVASSAEAIFSVFRFPIGSSRVAGTDAGPISCEQTPSKTLRFSSNWREPLLLHTGDDAMAGGCQDFCACAVPTARTVGRCATGRGLECALTDRFGELPELKNKIKLQAIYALLIKIFVRNAPDIRPDHRISG
jgi:hypothetical protein